MAEFPDIVRDLKDFGGGRWGPIVNVPARLLRDAADEIEELRGLIDRVQSLHNPRGGRDDAGFFCSGCGRNPCPTRTLTDGEPIFANERGGRYHQAAPLALCENCGTSLTEHGRLAECWPAGDSGSSSHGGET